MADNAFMRVEEVAQELGVSVSYAYRIIQKLNAEMREKGFLSPGKHRILISIRIPDGRLPPTIFLGAQPLKPLILK